MIFNMGPFSFWHTLKTAPDFRFCLWWFEDIKRSWFKGYKRGWKKAKIELNLKQ